MPFETMDVYATHVMQDGGETYTEQSCVGDVQLDADNMPDELEINGYEYHIVHNIKTFGAYQVDELKVFKTPPGGAWAWVKRLVERRNK